MSKCNILYSIILIRSLHIIFVLDVDDCMPNPCENDGNCTDGVNEYLCACVPGYTGADCETGQHCCKLTYKMNASSNVDKCIFQTLSTGNHCNVSQHNNLYNMWINAYFKFLVLKIIAMCQNITTCTIDIQS